MSYYSENLLGFTKITPKNTKGITDEEYRDQLEWLIKFAVWKTENSCKPFDTDALDAINCTLGEEKQYPETCHLWPGLYYRECTLTAEKLRIAYEKDLEGIIIEGFCTTKIPLKYPDVDMMDSKGYWKVIKELALVEADDGCHMDFIEDYESPLDFYLSNAKDESYIDYIDGLIRLDEDALHQIQKDVIDDIEKIIENYDE